MKSSTIMSLNYNSLQIKTDVNILILQNHHDQTERWSDSSAGTVGACTGRSSLL